MRIITTISIAWFCLLIPFCGSAVNNELTDFFIYHRQGRYLEAYQLAEEAKCLANVDTIEYVKYLGCLGECETELEYYDQAASHLHEAEKLCEILRKQETMVYCNILLKFAFLHSCLEEDSLSANFANRAWELTESLTPRQSDEYCEKYFEYYAFSDVDSIDWSIIEYAKSKGGTIAQRKALKIESDYADSTLISIQLLEKACKLFLGSDSLINYSEYAQMIHALGQQYTLIGQYEAAYNCFELSYRIYQKTHGSCSYNSLATLVDMATTKDYEGEYEYANIILETAKECARTKYGINSVKYAEVLASEAVNMFHSNNINGAIHAQKKANDILKLNPYEQERYLNGLLSLTTMLSTNKQASEALETMNQYFEAINNDSDNYSIEYTMGNLYTVQLKSNNVEAANLLEKNLSLLDNMNEDDCWREKAQGYEYLAELLEEDNPEMALLNINKALKVFENRIDVHHTNYLSVLGLKAEILYKLKKYDLSLELFSNYISLRKEDISRRFIGFDKRSRRKYWEQYLFPFIQMIPIEAFMLRDNPASRTLFYNSILFKKGILLNAELVFDSTKSPKINILQNWQDNTNLDSLIVSFNTSLMNNNKIVDEDYNYYKNLINIEYVNVCESLKSEEVAIEFATIPFTQDSILYCALVAKPYYAEPKLIPLCYESELYSIDKNEMFLNDSLYQLIWLPLKDEIEHASKIYFAPDRILYNIPIEYAYINDDTYLSDFYRIHRVSSTRELTKRNQPRPSINNTILFGGLNYDANTQDIIKANQNNDLSTDSFKFAERSSVEGISMVEIIPYTKQEVSDVRGLFPSNVNCEVYSGDEGTEDVFKSYSGERINVIHLSTHGFYWTKSKFPTSVLEKRLYSDIKCDEDSAMTRTGLYLAGSNNIVKGVELPFNMEDGIITAYEISNLYFNDLDLVVLSACQTGLGDLRGDGVFGLQRGFKKAGAKTVLMSLWNVNDLATKILMVEFYKNFLSGTGKQKSLQLAQRHVKEYVDDKGVKLFNSPYYWAGFVLLDALD